MTHKGCCNLLSHSYVPASCHDMQLEAIPVNISTSCCRYMALWLAAIGGEMIKLDHSFKAAKRVKDSTGQQQFAAVLTIMNEFCQVRHVGCACYVVLHSTRNMVQVDVDIQERACPLTLHSLQVCEVGKGLMPCWCCCRSTPPSPPPPSHCWRSRSSWMSSWLTNRSWVEDMRG
jgi:hypothetical protein